VCCNMTGISNYIDSKYLSISSWDFSDTVFPSLYSLRAFSNLDAKSMLSRKSVNDNAVISVVVRLWREYTTYF